MNSQLKTKPLLSKAKKKKKRPLTLTVEQWCKVPRCNAVASGHRRCVLAHWKQCGCVFWCPSEGAGVSWPLGRLLLRCKVSLPVTLCQNTADSCAYNNIFAGLCKQEHIWTMQKKDLSVCSRSHPNITRILFGCLFFRNHFLSFTFHHYSGLA